MKLVADGEERVQTLIVKKDPNSAGTETDIRAQVALLSELREMSNSVVDMINQMEWIRKQIIDLWEIHQDDKAAAPILVQGREFDQKLMAIEGDLIELRLTGGSQDWLRWPARFYAKLSSLAGSVGSTDFPPTSQQAAVFEMYRMQLTSYRGQFDKLLKKDLLILNNLLREKNIPAVTLLHVP